MPPSGGKKGGRRLRRVESASKERVSSRRAEPGDASGNGGAAVRRAHDGPVLSLSKGGAEQSRSSANVTIAVAALVVIAAGVAAWMFMSASSSGGGKPARKPPGGSPGGAERLVKLTPVKLTPAEKFLGKLKADAEALAAEGDFDGAVQVFGSIPDEHAEEIGEEAAETAEAMRRRAERRIDSVLGRANRAFHQGAFARALEILDGMGRLKYSKLQPGVAHLRRRIEHAKATVEGAIAARPSAEEVAREQKERAARKRLGPILNAFDRAVARGDLNGARVVVAGALADRSLAGIRAELDALGAVSGHVAALKEGEERALRELARKRPAIELRLADGKAVPGRVLSVRDAAKDPKIVLHAEVGGKHTIRAFRLAELDPAFRTKLLHPGEPRSDDDRIARALLAMISLDLKTARRTLDAAVEHPLAEHYAEELRKLEGGER